MPDGYQFRNQRQPWLFHELVEVQVYQTATDRANLSPFATVMAPWQRRNELDNRPDRWPDSCYCDPLLQVSYLYHLHRI